MSERSARQRAFIESARKISNALFVRDNYLGDDEDFHTLRELNYGMQLGSAMFLGGEYGVNPGTTLEDYIKSAQGFEDEIKKLKKENEHLKELVTEGGTDLGRHG